MHKEARLKRICGTKIQGFMGKLRGMEKKREKNQTNEIWLGVKRSVKHDLLHYLLFSVRLSWFETLWLLIDIMLEKKQPTVLGSAVLICSAERGRVEQDREGRRQLNVTHTAGDKACVNEHLSVTISLNTHTHSHTATNSTNTQTHTSTHND